MAVSLLSRKLDSQDLIDKIARNLHESYMGDCLPRVVSGRITPLERALLTEDPLHTLTARYKAEIKTDLDWFDWRQVAIRFPDTDRYMIYHDYIEFPGYETILCDGFVEGAQFKIERWYFSHREEEPSRALSDTLARYGDVNNQIPFQYFGDEFEADALTNIDRSYDSGKSWQNVERVLAWFDQFR